MSTKRVGFVSLVVAFTVAIAAPGGALQAPAASLRSEQKLSPAYAQGIARYGKGWILSGRNVLARVDNGLHDQKLLRNAIPPDWVKTGYNHIGDIDVVGRCVYAPLEQSNFELGFQAMARFDAKTLRFVDALPVGQHENSFVAIDPSTMTAYSMDRFDGSELLRYDVGDGGWEPLPPLVMDATLQHTQGADVLGGAVWISTSDPQNNLYRVDTGTGHVDLVGSTGHLPGEGEGIDVTGLRSGLLHTLTIDPKLNPVWLGHFDVAGDDANSSRAAGSGRCRPTR